MHSRGCDAAGRARTVRAIASTEKEGLSPPSQIPNRYDQLGRLFAWVGPHRTSRARMTLTPSSRNSPPGSEDRCMSNQQNVRRDRRMVKLEQALHERLRHVEEEVSRKLLEVRAGERDVVDPTNGAWDTSTADNAVLILDVMVQTRDQIRQALTRLRAGRFGVCHSCGRDIPLMRLQSLPFALRCRPCEELKEATSKPRGAHRRNRLEDFDP